MPDRVLRKSVEYWREHPQGVLLVLLAMTLVVAIWGWSRANNAQVRLNKIEVANQAQLAAAEEGKKIGQVITCFTAARSRPLLTTVLRALAGRETDPITRTAYDVLISAYETQTIPGIRGTPTRDKCAELGEELGVDYDAYDFDPISGRLRNPPR
jgi:type II secretory pathway pseudopilin PulG